LSKKRNISAFTIIVTFIALALAGIAMVPFLSVRLSPSRALPGMGIHFAMPNNSSRVVESEVTGKLEGLLTGVAGVKSISSSSWDGGGTISIQFDRHADMEMTRFEIATIIRQAWEHLPQGVTYPSISMRRPDDNKSGPFLIYTLNAHSNPIELQRFCEENLKPIVANIKGVSAIDIHGARPMQWQLLFDTNHINSLGISVDDIRNAISSNYGTQYIGLGHTSADTDEKWLRITLNFDVTADKLNMDMPIKVVNGKLVTLREIVKVKHVEEEHDSYFRVNGNNSVYVNITADETANQLTLGNKVKKLITEFASTLPHGYSISPIYDAGDSIESELHKIYFRTALTLLILLLFVAIVTLSWRYVLLITISISLTIGIACAFYYLLGIEIQLYSLAGITISLNLIIDNLIVMTDHISRHRNLRAFTSVLAASLTTMGALSVVYFLDDATRLNLQDFVGVIIINLAVSLASALFLVPALIDKLSLRRRKSRGRRGRCLRLASRFLTNVYAAVVKFLCRHKVIAFTIVVFAFGFPVFLIPDKIENDDSPFARKYNEITTSSFYKETFKPIFDKIFGGTLRLFAEKVPEGGYFSRGDNEVRLQINATLPNGATLAQMNSLITKMERYLEGFHQIKRFETSVQSGRRASISVQFLPEYAHSGFPYQLKGDVIRKALTLGGGSWSVYGLEDMGFNNEFHERSGSSVIKLTGYNYDDLQRISTQLRDSLLTYRRIKEVEIRSEVSFWKDDYSELYIDIDRRRLTEAGIDLHTLFNAISPFFGKKINCGAIEGIHGNESITLQSKQSAEFDVWAMMNHPITIAGRTYKVKDFATMNRRQAPQAVAKENQQYVLYAQYEYIGSYKQAENIQKKLIDRFNASLPLGYKLEKHQYFYLRHGDEGWSKYWLLLFVGTIIFFISAILFNSLRQPLAIICIIPPSFIGIFLVFYIFNFNFDQGGFASFILLSGITVNAAIYIINEFNHIRRKRPNLPVLAIYMKAFNRKLVPIFLTVLSTILGFIPFIVGTSRESFWFPLAIGTMGGLIMSVVILILYLPLFLIPAPRRQFKRKKSATAQPCANSDKH